MEEILLVTPRNPATKFSIMGEGFDRAPLPRTRLNPLVHPQYLEVFGEDCDKGRAILRYCELFGISIEQCACFGDSMNDYAMFKACPISVCMKNSPVELTKIAKGADVFSQREKYKPPKEILL